MKTSKYLLVVAAAGFGAVISGCFEGPNGIPGNHRNNDAPIVVTDTPTTLASLEFDLTFTVYDPDSDSVILWDVCPYDVVGGVPATPILNVGFSTDNGGTFSPIDFTDLQLNGEALVVPTCSQVRNFDESIRIATSTSGEQHTITWNSIPYVPTTADVVFRIAATDNSFTSLPGDTDEFPVANLPGFSMSIMGARPNESIVGVDFFGLLTNWDGTTVIGSSDNLTLTNFAVVSTSAATADVTMGPDTDQVLRTVELITPGAGIPSGDEVAAASIWTCNELGQPVIEFDGASSQFICNQGTFDIQGDITEGDADVFQLVANSSGDYAISFDWTVGTDYDLVVLNEAGTAIVGAPGPFNCGDCCSEAKPEVCLAPLEAGTSYLILVQHYAGGAGTYDVTVTAP